MVEGGIGPIKALNQATVGEAMPPPMVQGPTGHLAAMPPTGEFPSTMVAVACQDCHFVTPMPGLSLHAVGSHRGDASVPSVYFAVATVGRSSMSRLC